MRDTELFDLCKSVYEKTGWDSDDLLHYLGGEIHYKRLFESDMYHLNTTKDTYCPLYTPDYLLGKLPKWIEYEKNQPHLLTLQPNPIGAGWNALYRLSVATPTSARNHAIEIHEADTSLKALLKLTLALHEAGELTTPLAEVKESK